MHVSFAASKGRLLDQHRVPDYQYLVSGGLVTTQESLCDVLLLLFD